jgi:glutamate-5-semialdehyde dehydrogenase
VTSTIERAQLIRGVAEAARAAAKIVAKASAPQRTEALIAIADVIVAQREDILAANRTDVSAAESRGMAPALIDRLRLDDSRIATLARAIREIAAQPELVGRIERVETRPNGLEVSRMRVPLGVVAIIYEARPNVTTDAAALCLKAGDACILRGGSEADASNRALAACVHSALDLAGLPPTAVQLVPTTDREAIAELVRLDELIDLCIPRGGEGLVRFVTEHARVPVIKHYKGVCHVYVHAEADLVIAERIVDNAKLSRPGVCNAMETLLVDRAVAEQFIPTLVASLAPRCELRGDDTVRALGGGRVRPATEADWYAEFLDRILAIRVVDGIAQAIAHVERYGSQHTDAIITRDTHAADKFLREVDSSTVLVNASTRFADGGELGLGAEIGISTTKLHAYGPMGLASLTALKWIAYGEGQTR